MASEHGFVITPGSFGQPFTLSEAGPLRFDIPLDPETDIVVEKSSVATTGDVGDYINYTVTIRNQGISTAPIRLFDTLPVCLLYTSPSPRD